MKIEIAPFGGSTYTDVTDIIKFGGLTPSTNTVDADGAGRNLLGQMMRKKVAVKQKYEAECIPIDTATKTMLDTLLVNEWLSVRITLNGSATIYKMYPGATINATYAIKKGNVELWSGYKFSLIEQ